jgi:hypothetical protein
LERFKSHRRFSQEIKKVVPLSSPLFVYADTMNDFNFYLEREVIPVIASSTGVDNLIGRPENGYMLVKERDLEKLPRLAPEWIVASESLGSATWYLVKFNTSSAN